jgi:hypothetical protein
MGMRNLDRIPMAEWRRKIETVADMDAARWEVISQCGACRLMMVVNLITIARLSGAETSLWNRKERCRRIGCNGVVRFLAKVPGTRAHRPLEADWPQGKAPMG